MRKELAKGCLQVGLDCLRMVGKFLLVLALFLVVLYIEEDWRGARELAAAKQRWQDAGYSLKPSDYYPPPVPDDQNLAALPIFQLEPDPQQENKPSDLRLRDATDEDKHGGEIFSYATGAKHDAEEFAANARAAYAKMFPGKTPPVSASAQLEELYPLIPDLRNGAATRPEFRLKLDYDFEPPWARTLGPITTQIHLAKLLSYDAKLALSENQPQVAADDLRVGYEIARGVGADPSLVAGLVALGVEAITRGTSDEGLEKHRWNDAQLAQIEDDLKRTDNVAMYQHVMSGEAVVFSLQTFAWSKTHPEVMRMLLGYATLVERTEAPRSAELVWYLFASGWWDMNAAQMLDLMRKDVRCADGKTRRMDSSRLLQIETEAQKAKDLPWGAAPGNILYAVAAGPMTRAMEKFAQGQAQVDEDRIVCALERYRLAHGAYPATLDALVPAYIDALPHDIMNGEAYHYRVKADATFLLYSVGWNQIDDGGTVIYSSDNPKMIDYDNGDWVWPMVKR